MDFFAETKIETSRTKLFIQRSDFCKNTCTYKEKCYCKQEFTQILTTKYLPIIAKNTT